ncbi:hypothetical protein ACLOJK_033340 [Asimina triloba]
MTKGEGREMLLAKGDGVGKEMMLLRKTTMFSAKIDGRCEMIERQGNENGGRPKETPLPAACERREAVRKIGGRGR